MRIILRAILRARARRSHLRLCPSESRYVVHITHEKKIAGLPQIRILTLSLRNLTSPNFCIQACTREYAALH